MKRSELPRGVLLQRQRMNPLVLESHAATIGREAERRRGALMCLPLRVVVADERDANCAQASEATARCDE